MSIENIINKAWENKDQVSPNSDKNLKDAINQIIDDLDRGKVRVADRKGDKWRVNQWVKKAILLSFRINKMTMSKGPYTTWYDKVPGKSVEWNESDWKKTTLCVC